MKNLNTQFYIHFSTFLWPLNRYGMNILIPFINVLSCSSANARLPSRSQRNEMVICKLSKFVVTGSGRHLSFGDYTEFQWSSVADFAACQSLCTATLTCQQFGYIEAAGSKCVLSASAFIAFPGNLALIRGG